ncbi:MAG TPA: MBL fold metallo-hydrolase [Symbiobacteriaceae bacterium]|nr:MBL fold metallo-hydrolase [Symbiobacteriaceae bacterium]
MMRHYSVERLAAGVYAALATNEGSAGCNAGIIDLGDRTLLFDTAATLSAARELRALAVELTGRAPSYVVNSHEHPDHYNGNAVFDDALLITSAATREAMARGGAARMAGMRRQIEERAAGVRQALAQSTEPERRGQLEAELQEYMAFSEGYPHEEDLRLAALTFTGSLAWVGTARTAQMIAYGPAHSACDTVLWLPTERVLFTGDLVVDGGDLILALGTPENWPPVLDRLAGLGAERIVPGHGAVVGAAEGLGQAQAYLAEIFRLAGQAAAAGLTADEVAAPAGWTEYWFRRNMRRLLELSPV